MVRKPIKEPTLKEVVKVARFLIKRRRRDLAAIVIRLWRLYRKCKRQQPRRAYGDYGFSTGTFSDNI